MARIGVNRNQDAIAQMLNGKKRPHAKKKMVFAWKKAKKN